jgi:N-acetylmuramoyl-L-alanine amidase
MKMRNGPEKIKVLLMELGLFLWLWLLVFSSPADAHSDPVVFEKAKTCQARLQNSKQTMKYRDQWEKCIRLYQKYIASSEEHSTKEEALFRLAELRLGLAKSSGKPRDFKKAEGMVKELKMKYPDSRFSFRVENRPDKAQRTIPDPQKTVLSRLKDIRYWSYPDYTRVVLDLSRGVTYHHEKESKPDRLWINIDNTQLENRLGEKLMTIKDGILTQIKAIQHTPNTVRVMLGLQDASDYRVVHFSDPDRVVVDVFGKPAVPGFNRIVIDPGHGGKDPGAIGRNGLTEKEVVLDVGLRLKDLIQKNLDREVLMTRNRDVYIPLEERTQLANGKRADLFISIHANASPNRRARGVEIYTLGQATDSSALATAARENSIQVESLKNLDGAIRVMLADLSIMRRLDDSLEFADATRQAFVKYLGKNYDVTDLGVKEAPFYVLMNAGMPSILAEISFISNPVEEKRLASRPYREKIAQSLFEGIRQYILGNSQDSRLQPLNISE